MNTLSKKLLQLVIIALGFCLFTNCGGGSGPTPEERVTKQTGVTLTATILS
jgi:hypothetical protein